MNKKLQDVTPKGSEVKICRMEKAMTSSSESPVPLAQIIEEAIATRESATNKLLNLGLTEEEIKAILS